MGHIFVFLCMSNNFALHTGYCGRMWQGTWIVCYFLKSVVSCSRNRLLVYHYGIVGSWFYTLLEQISLIFAFSPTSWDIALTLSYGLPEVTFKCLRCLPSSHMCWDWNSKFGFPWHSSGLHPMLKGQPRIWGEFICRFWSLYIFRISPLLFQALWKSQVPSSDFGRWSFGFCLNSNCLLPCGLGSFLWKAI